jgi:NTP pyrophosphatase (non-canonical NTP hydrolase)
MSKYSVSKLKKIMTRLRDPKNECLWDKKQTIETIIPHTIEEVYELTGNIKKKFTGIEEELGDLVF